MIQIVITCSKDGCLRSCTAEGHAGYAGKGADIVCAAATAVMRTVLAVLEQSFESVSTDNRAERGKLHFAVPQSVSFSEEQAYLLKYSSRFLFKGLSDLEKEYPQYISVKKNFCN